MNVSPRLTLLIAAALPLFGCGGNPPEAPTAPVALVEVLPATTRAMHDTLSVYGTTEFAAASAATLAVQVESQVGELLVTAGMQVKRGQALLRLVPSPNTRLEVGKARRDAKLAVAERDRLQRLRAEGLATESDLQTAITAAAAAAENRDSLSARVGPDQVLTLRAPRDGIVDTLTVQPGDVLAAGTVAVRISAPDALQVRLGVEPEDAHRIAAGQPVTLATLNAQATRVNAQLSDADRRIDPQTRLIAALVQLPAHSGLMAGAVLRGEIVVAQHDEAIAVPRSALLYTGEKAHLFLAAGNKAHRREVKTGFREEDVVEITEGLTAGESVVVSGNSVLEDGMAIRVQSDESSSTATDVDDKP